MKPFDNLKNTLKFYSDNFFNLFVLICPAHFISALLSLYKDNFNNVILWTILYFVFTATIIPLSTISAVIQIQNPKFTLIKSIKKSLKFYWKYIGLEILVYLIVLAGFISFIIPGIFLSFIFVLITYVLVDNNKSIIETITLTRFYAHKNLGKIFLNSLFIGAFCLIIYMIFASLSVSLRADPKNIFNVCISLLIGSLLFPVSMIYFNNLYFDLKSSIDHDKYKDFPKRSKLIGFSIIFSCVVIITLIVLSTLKINHVFGN